MKCRYCGADMNKRGLDNVSPFADYPICEDCIGDVCCSECSKDTDIVYVEEFDEILCKDCLIEESERRCYIHSAKTFYDDDYREIGSDDNTEQVVEYLKEFLNIQEAPR